MESHKRRTLTPTSLDLVPVVTYLVLSDTEGKPRPSDRSKNKCVLTLGERMCVLST